MTAGSSNFAAIATSSLPPVNGDPWNVYHGSTLQAPTLMSATYRGIDLNRIQQLSYALQAPPTTDASSVQNTFASVQERIRKRRDNIITKLFTDEIQKTRACCDKMHAMRMQKDWDRQKELCMKELVGDRRLGGSSNVAKFDSGTVGQTISHSDLQGQIAEHLRLIKDLKHKTDNAEVIHEFTRLASKTPSYAAAWKLIYALQQRRSDSSLGRAIATMSHLSRQFQAHVANRVRSATTNRQVHVDSKYTGMSRTVASYVNLTLGSQASHWAIIFYCLRCGDCVGAKQVLDAHEPSHILAATLEGYAKQQGSEPYFWDQITFVDAFPVSTHQTTDNEFEKSCISLLAGLDTLGSSSVVGTIEDFVYVSLWHVIVSDTQKQEALIAIGLKIKELGPRHFQGDDSTNVWSYVMPLLLTQQYRSSMLHLAESDGRESLLQATHLSLFLPELKDLDGPASQCLLTKLLVEYAAMFAPSSPSNALQYLILIPDQSLRRSKIVELIVESRQFEELAGFLSIDGIRRGTTSSLDEHFPAKVVCDLLEEAALLANAKENTRDALELLNLAERYVSLLSMLNKKLASLLNQSPGKEKDFWLKACRDFDNWHFSGRRTHAMEVIEASNSVSLVDVFHTLLKLFDFFDRLLMHDFKDATSIIDGLYLLPQATDELQAKVNSYKAMDPVLKQIFPPILEGAMDSIYQQFVRTKYSGMIRDEATMQQQRQELKSKASLLTSFAGALQQPLDLRSRMANMEAQMI